MIESLCPIHSLLEYIRWGPISPEVIGDDIDNDSDHDDSDDDNNNNDDNDNDGAIKLYNLNEQNNSIYDFLQEKQSDRKD